LEDLWPLWRFPSCRFPLQQFVSPKRYTPIVGGPSIFFVCVCVCVCVCARGSFPGRKTARAWS
jgi:hypothetical protein